MSGLATGLTKTLPLRNSCLLFWLAQSGVGNGSINTYIAFATIMAVVEIWASQTSKLPLIMHLLRCVHFFVAYYDLTLFIQHVPGKLNVLADAISRNLLQVMHTASPPLCQYATPVPSSLWQMLVTLRPDWLSPHWSQLWTASLMPV